METNKEPHKVRHDWYQTESHVYINVLCRNVKEDGFHLKYETDTISLSFNTPETTHDMEFKLLHEINPAECSSKITSSKIEIKLKKKEGFRWASLENDDSIDKSLKQAMATTAEYPSSSNKSKDWDKVVGDFEKNDNEAPEGDAALRSLFQKIYSEGSDEVKKAMNKSFVESSGTVLSTNWNEVKKEKVNMKPPDGMEWKKWD